MKLGIAQRPKAGNLVCGDAYLVLETGPRVTVAVADGLGSGEKANHSSKMAIQGVAEHTNASLTDILSLCHYMILAAGGVGVMIAILRLDRNLRSLEYAGVGNIRFLAHSKHMIQPITRFGYLGVRLPTLRSYRFPYTPGDIFVLHTDGISTRFHLHNHLQDLGKGPQTLADHVLKEYGKFHDDATVAIVRTEDRAQNH